MRTLIAGCGYVGTELARRLADDGEEVWGLTLDPDGLPRGVRPLAADLRDPATLASLPEVDRAVFAAAPREHDEPAYRATYLDGLRNLVTALSSAARPPRRLAVCSSMSVYGQRDGSRVDETSETVPARFSGRVMLEAERAALAGPIPAVVVRLAGIYGDERRRIVERVRSGEAMIPPGVSAFTNLVHRDDCAGILRHLLELDDPAPIYVGVDDEPVPHADVLRYLARLMGLPEPAVGEDPNASPWLRKKAGDLGKRLDNRLLRASGYRFELPTYREGYAAIVAALPQ